MSKVVVESNNSQKEFGRVKDWSLTVDPYTGKRYLHNEHGARVVTAAQLIDTSIKNCQRTWLYLPSPCCKSSKKEVMSGVGTGNDVYLSSRRAAAMFWTIKKEPHYSHLYSTSRDCSGTEYEACL